MKAHSQHDLQFFNGKEAYKRHYALDIKTLLRGVNPYDPQRVIVIHQVHEDNFLKSVEANLDWI